MDQEPQQSSEWRRRITESMAATTYEQLKALVEGVTGGFSEVASSFATLDKRLDQIETALNEARVGFGDEAERVRGAFAKHSTAVSERVGASAELVQNLSGKTQEISGHLATLSEEISNRLQTLHAEQTEGLSGARAAITEAVTSISANVDASISALSKDVNEQSAIVDAALRATNEALERQASAIAALERTHGAAVESARASLSGAIDELKRRAEEGARANEKTSTELQSTVAQIVQRIDDTRELLRKETLSAVGEVRTAITEAVLERLEELSRRMLDLRTGPEEIAQVLRGVVHEQSSDVGTRWDDLVSTLARQRGYNGMASADDVFLVALVRSLEQVLDERDRRLVTMLDGIARSLPSRRRAGFLSRARKTIAETDEPGSKPSL